MKNIVAETVQQHCIDFLSVNYVELPHYILCHFHFNHLQHTCPAALVLADLERVKQAVQTDGK
jgi:hypothetical protein